MYFRTAIVTAFFFILGNCENVCEEHDKVATCGEGATFPLDISNDVEKLVVHSPLIKNLNAEDFINYNNLKSLDLSNCAIETIHSDAFVKNEKLEEINLSHNPDLIIPEENPLFASKSLKTLNLEDTGITELPENAFKLMENLASLNLGSNRVEEIEKALENALQLETLIVMKGDEIDRDIICARTSIKKIISKYFDDNNQEMSDTYNCVEDQEAPKEEVDEEKIEELVPESTTEEIAHTEETTDHSEFCKNENNLNFNGEIKCDVKEDSVSCELSCPEGMKPETEFINPYKCEFNQGIFQPDVPKCIQDKQELPKIDTKLEEPKLEEPNNDLENEDASAGEKKMELNLESRAIIPHLEVSNGNSIDEATNDAGITSETKDKATSKDVNGSTIVLTIIVIVVVIGALGVGFKYWRNHRGYHNTRTDDVETGKEMKTISSNADKLLQQKE